MLKQFKTYVQTIENRQAFAPGEGLRENGGSPFAPEAFCGRENTHENPIRIIFVRENP